MFWIKMLMFQIIVLLTPCQKIHYFWKELENNFVSISHNLSYSWHLFWEHYLIALASENTSCPFGYPVAIKIRYSPTWKKKAALWGSQFWYLWKYLSFGDFLKKNIFFVPVYKRPPRVGLPQDLNNLSCQWNMIYDEDKLLQWHLKPSQFSLPRKAFLFIKYATV